MKVTNDEYVLILKTLIYIYTKYNILDGYCTK